MNKPITPQGHGMGWNKPDELDDLFSDIRQTCDDCEHPRCLSIIKSVKAAICATKFDKSELELRRAAKLSILNQLAIKEIPKGDDIHPEYSRGFMAMQGKVKFELKRLSKLKQSNTTPHPAQEK